MSAIVILLIAAVCFIAAYITYGSWLAKQWGVENDRVTPAHELEDGVDYVPAAAPVLLGHHFASIAGAGPINGPIQAAVFGWVPVFLWITIGGIFFGAVHDYAALFVSIRHKGKSLGEVMEEAVNHKCMVLFNVFAWLVLILVIAAFADIVAKTFIGASYGGSVANGSVATASLLFIPLAIVFGFLVYRKHAPLLISTIVGVILLAVCIAVGLACPLDLPKNFWLIFILVYLVVASVTPVWILLQPRDYLNSFLLYFMMIAAMIGILFTNPTVQLPAFTSFKTSGGTMFPYLFITVACGAISGFHSLVGSGTTSKQVDKESDAKMIGYGGMLIECLLAVISLIAVGVLTTDGVYSQIGTPAIVFATAVAGFFEKLGFGASAVSATFTVISLAISAFALTSLDTATRMGRFLFQELFAGKGEKKNILSNMYVSTLITGGLGMLLCIGGYDKIWPLFGACNQLVAVPCFLAASVWLAKNGKNGRMMYIPMVFMICASGSTLVLKIISNIKNLASGVGTLPVEGLQTIIAVPILVCGIILVIEGMKALVAAEKAKSARA